MLTFLELISQIAFWGFMKNRFARLSRAFQFAPARCRRIVRSGISFVNRFKSNCLFGFIQAC